MDAWQETYQTWICLGTASGRSRRGLLWRPRQGPGRGSSNLPAAPDGSAFRNCVETIQLHRTKLQSRVR